MLVLLVESVLSALVYYYLELLKENKKTEAEAEAPHQQPYELRHSGILPHVEVGPKDTLSTKPGDLPLSPAR